MTDKPKLCAATTKSGAPCKNKAQPNSNYCYVHRNLAVSAPSKTPVDNKPKPTTAKSSKSAARPAAKPVAKATKATTSPTVEPVEKPPLNQIAVELDRVVDEIRTHVPDYTPPPFSPQALMAMLKENLHRFTPELQLDIVNRLKANLEDADPHSLVEPETWKSLWYMLNYSLNSQSSTFKDQLAHRLSTLPGVAQLSNWTSNLDAPSAKELLDVETWKGAWHVLNHSLKAQADELKRKWTGDAEEK
ncbi:hypothetical protein BH10CHL1_BH10CHL1_25610 [soil metagenome]